MTGPTRGAKVLLALGPKDLRLYGSTIDVTGLESWNRSLPCQEAVCSRLHEAHACLSVCPSVV